MNARTAPDSLVEPPWSCEAEQAVLGALMLDPQAIDRVAGIVTPESFFTLGHRTVFDVISLLVASDKPVDVVTVFERIEARGALELVGGLPYLNALAQGVSSAANIRRHAEIIAERAAARRLWTATDEAATIARGDGASADKLDRIGAIFDRLERTGQRSAPKAFGELIVAALDRYNALADGSVEPGIPTGFRQLDKMLSGGLKPGKVVCVAARPSVGKSSTARSIGLNVAKTGRKVLVLSQEMPQDEQADCVLAELGGINNERLQTGQLSPEDWSRLSDAAEEAKDLPLLFDEQGALTLGDIRAKARGVKGLGLLVVDYLQLCSSTLKGASTNDQVAEISKGLKALALEMRIPVIVLSQLNRDVEKRADREPQLSDLRDSGAIEQDIDIAVMLWTLEDHGDSRVVGFKVAKHRGGRKGSFAMRFDAPIYRWTDCDFPQRPISKRGDL